MKESAASPVLLFIQSGGFAGVRTGCVVDVQSLPPKARAGLKAFRRNKEEASSSRTARDVFAYRLTVKDAKGEKTFRFDERSVPPPARSLIAFLSSRSAPIA